MSELLKRSCQLNKILALEDYSELRWGESQLQRFFWRGSSRNHLPEYLIRLTNGKILVIEVKGEETDQSKAKHAAMQQWKFAVVYKPHAIYDLLRP
jgi:hypothetical protein